MIKVPRQEYMTYDIDSVNFKNHYENVDVLLQCIVLYSIVLYYIVLYCIVLYCIVLYYI